MSDNITNKVNGDTVDASEWNQFADIDNAIITSGQTPSTGDLFQISKAMANYAAQGSVFGTDSGIADAYVITQIPPFRAPDALRNGMTITFNTVNSNTGSCTVNAFSLGVKAIKKADGMTNPSAGDIFGDISLRYDGTNFRIVNNFVISQLPSGSNLQIVNTQTAAAATGTTTIPYDDTIPQSTEGNQYMSLSITPSSVASKLKIDVVIYASGDVVSRTIAALFQDSTTNALCANSVSQTTEAGTASPICFTYYMTAATISSTTFKVRAGLSVAGTTTLNGISNNRRLGGTNYSSITITEIKA